MRLTIDLLEQSYVLLGTTAPFKRWKLPPVDDIELHVTRHLDRCGDYDFVNGVHRIRLSEHLIGNLDRLLRTMAHEMVHLRQTIETPEDKAHHGSYFREHARKVCKVHGWDLKDFIA